MGGGPPRRYDSDYDFEKANEKFQETMSHLKEDFAKAKIGGKLLNEDVFFEICNTYM